MIILTLRTDNPESEIGIFEDDRQIAYVKWLAHRELAETIHNKIKTMLEEQDLDLSRVEGIAIYEGPGSFTGLRIGITVANALADSLHIPIVSGTGDHWLQELRKRLLEGENDKLVQPEYGAMPHITQQKK